MNIIVEMFPQATKRTLAALSASILSMDIPFPQPFDMVYIFVAWPLASFIGPIVEKCLLFGTGGLCFVSRRLWTLDPGPGTQGPKTRGTRSQGSENSRTRDPKTQSWKLCGTTSGYKIATTIQAIWDNGTSPNSCLCHVVQHRYTHQRHYL